ncbi:MAG: beta-lactamase family protein [Chloroflexi bacterium]|nr:beta-lactamase family protein [Chloroflexota bacterium]
MRVQKLLLGSLVISAVLAVAHKLVAMTASLQSISNADSYDAIDAYIEKQMHRLHIPGVSLAIVEGDKIVHLRGFGKARPGGEAPTPQTPFFIGSLTKSFTALAIMQLVQVGKIELNAPIQRYLPWFRVTDPQASSETSALAPALRSGASVTVRHLLNQTSSMPGLLGMENLGNFDSRPNATERQARALSTLKLTRPVGSSFEYSNVNYNLLGLIIETVSGESYTDYVQPHIFDPLEMKHSYSSKGKAQRDNLAVGHCYWFGIPIPVPNLSIPLGSLPSGQLIASAEDVAHYLIANLNDGRYKDAQILSPAGINEMHRPAAEINEMGMVLGHYGMGWMIQETAKSRIVWHSGDVPDFGAFMALVPEQKKGIVILFNANHAMMKMTYDEVGISAAQLLAGQTPTPHQFDALPLAMRGLILIPILQIIGVIATLRQLRRWRLEPGSRPSRGRMWGRHILLPLIPNLSIALTLIPMLSKLRGFLMLFMPDYSLIALVCGSFSLVWSFLRTGLILRPMREKD